jgi:hypothetical protein
MRENERHHTADEGGTALLVPTAPTSAVMALSVACIVCNEMISVKVWFTELREMLLFCDLLYTSSLLVQCPTIKLQLPYEDQIGDLQL